MAISAIKPPAAMMMNMAVLSVPSMIVISLSAIWTT
jgi:hypothetical protein